MIEHKGGCKIGGPFQQVIGVFSHVGIVFLIGRRTPDNLIVGIILVFLPVIPTLFKLFVLADVFVKVVLFFQLDLVPVSLPVFPCFKGLDKFSESIPVCPDIEIDIVFSLQRG